MANILKQIFEARKGRVARAKDAPDAVSLVERAIRLRKDAAPNRFRDALLRSDRTNIIAEFKRQSPSKGVINNTLDPAATAAAYMNGGAAAISVLTEEDYFGGSLDDLRAVRNVVDLPILRKDFIFDAFQIYEAAESGADAVLLIVAMLGDDELRKLAAAADDLGLDALVEVHDPVELGRAAKAGATIIGVNNRNLSTFDVSLNVSRELIRLRPDGALMVAESGLSGRHEIDELRQLGFDGFLIGETLMRSADPAVEVSRLAVNSTHSANSIA